MSEEWKVDAVVVGAGVHGSSAALHLAKAGKRTLLLDQFPLPHSRGSSHGQSRIIRQANYSIPALTTIVTDACKKWKEIEEEAKETLVKPAPLLVMVNKDQRPLIEKIAASVEAGGHEVKWVTIEDVNATYGTNLPKGTLSIIDTSGGILLADRCVAALQRLFRQAGGQVVDSWPVDGFEVSENGTVRITGRRGTVVASYVVLCPGPWAMALLDKIGVHIPLRVERISVLYWRIRESFKTTSFVDLSLSEGHFYGLKEMEYPGLVKLVYHGGPRVDPEERDKISTQEMRSLTDNYIKERFPCLQPQPAIEESCMYTWTPDGEFVLDTHPKHKNIVFACGFSGTGFKIAPTIGLAASRMVLGLQPLHDLSPFSASRFSSIPKSRM